MTVSAPPDILIPEHQHQLVHESAILPEVLAEEDIRSLPSSLGLPTTNAALRHPNTHKGQHFGIWGETDDDWRPKDLGPGIWFGTHDAQGRAIGSYKPDRPRTAYNGRTVKYEGPRGTRPSFAVPVRCREALLNSKCDIVIPEGFKKGLAVASAGGCAIALTGVEAWSVKPAPNEPSEPIPDFDAIKWHGRTVWLAWDSDVREKDGVQYAERRLTEELDARGAIVIPLRIPHRPDGSKRGIDDYIADRLAAGVSRADALAELKSVALAELVRLSKLKREPAMGTDGEETCRNCAPLAERSREHKAELELIRRGPVPTAEALGIDHLVSLSFNARTRGEDVVPLYIPADAKSANVGTNTMARAIDQARKWQADPETAEALHFRIEEDWKGGKKHLKLRVLPLPDQDGAGWTKADEYRAIARLPRDAERGQHGNNGGKKIECPKHPDAALSRTRIWRCTEDECTWVHQDTALVGGVQHQDGAGEESTIYGASFFTEVHAASDDRHQDGGDSTSTSYRHQDGAGSLLPSPRSLSFVTRDDAELAAGPQYWGDPDPDAPPEAPPERPVPLIDPNPRTAYWSRPEHRPQAVSGGSE